MGTTSSSITEAGQETVKHALPLPLLELAEELEVDVSDDPTEATLKMRITKAGGDWKAALEGSSDEAGASGYATVTYVGKEPNIHHNGLKWGIHRIQGIKKVFDRHANRTQRTFTNRADAAAYEGDARFEVEYHDE